MSDCGFTSFAPRASIVFDPFFIGADHNAHSRATSIVKLEESGKVFCPICLNNNSSKTANEIMRIDMNMYDVYVRNFFEALDQYGDKEDLRKIVLPILQLLLRERPTRIKSDQDYHNLLKIVYKTLTNEKFRSHEFSCVVDIFAGISKNLPNSHQIPIQPLWKATEYMINYSKILIVKHEIQESYYPNTDLRQDSAKYFGSTCKILSTFLAVMRQFTVDQVSEIIFPLHENDDPKLYSRRYYQDAQNYCIDFMHTSVITELWPFFVMTTRPLERHEQAMTADFFRAVRECLLTSLKLKKMKFVDHLKQIDCLSVSRTLMLNIQLNQFKTHIRSFLRSYVSQYVKNYIGEDEHLSALFSNKAIVETNHKNAIKCSQKDDSSKIIFYFLLNYVAYKQKSAFFNIKFVKRVVLVVDPSKLNIEDSIILTKAYLYVASLVTTKVSDIKHIEQFVLNHWNDVLAKNNHDKFNELFCSSEQIINWVDNHAAFRNMITVKTIKHLIDNYNARGLVFTDTFRTLLLDDQFRIFVIEFLREDQDSPTVIEQVKCIERSNENPASGDDSTKHRILASELSAILPALMHGAILAYMAEDSNDHRVKLNRLIHMNISMLDKCSHFDLILDDQFVDDIMDLLEQYYRSSDERSGAVEIVVALNELIALMLSANSSSILSLLKRLEKSIMGYMLHHLCNMTSENSLVDSIARVLVAYDRLDYPMSDAVTQIMCASNPNPIYWSLSTNEDMNQMAIAFGRDILNSSDSRTVKACTAMGLLEMINSRPEIVKPENFNQLLNLVDFDEIRYNPLSRRIVDKLPPEMRSDFERKLSDHQTDRAPSPALSFVSAESNEKVEVHTTVVNILSQLLDDDVTVISDASSRIATQTFASQYLHDQHSSYANTDEWERLARQSTQETNGTYQETQSGVR